MWQSCCFQVTMWFCESWRTNSRKTEVTSLLNGFTTLYSEVMCLKSWSQMTETHTHRHNTTHTHQHSTCLKHDDWSWVWISGLPDTLMTPQEQHGVTLCLLVLLRLKKDSPLTSIVLDSARTQFTPETPEVFCGLTPPTPSSLPLPPTPLSWYFVCIFTHKP